MSKLYVVGIGPGKISGMTIEAYECLKSSQVIVGFRTYVDLIKDEFSDKEFFVTGMGAEKERCKKALDIAKEGKTVAIVCSGDASLYGMGALVHELATAYSSVDVIVIPGVTAALSGSAILGAVVGNDFASVSLSNYLTDWDKIKERLRALAKADMILALYNTRSHKRPDGLKNACDVLLEVLAKDTCCGVAVNIGRDNEHYQVMTLEELRDYEADMFTTVFVGNSATKVINNRLVTPRGYLNE